MKNNKNIATLASVDADSARRTPSNAIELNCAVGLLVCGGLQLVTIANCFF